MLIPQGTEEVDLVEGAKVVELETLGADAGGKDEPLRVKGRHRSTRQVHQTLPAAHHRKMITAQLIYR